MFNFLKDSSALEKSMSKSLDREDDGFDHIRSNMNHVIKAVSLGKDMVVGGAQVYNDIKEAGRAMDSTSGQKRTTSQGGIKLDSGKKPKYDVVSQRTPVGFSSLNNIASQGGIGASATAVLGNKTSVPISLKLGNQLSISSSIENFLSLFNQTGTLSSSFGGRLKVAQDDRSRVFHCFRHNLHSQPTNALPNQGIVDNAAYPTGAKILTVQGSLTVDTVSVVNSQIQDLTNGGVYFAPYNKPDLEDVSFNLNKFKLGPVSTLNNPDYSYDHGNSTVSMPTNSSGTDSFYRTKIALLNDVNPMLGVLGNGDHRALSAIHQNNARIASFSSATNYTSAPYKYDALLKQGTVDYLFMNKGSAPLVVEVIVYRVKQNGHQAVPSKFSEFNLENQLEKIISAGNYNKYLGGFGTDNLAPASGINGSRSQTSWYTDADLPFLPSCREIDQSELAYKEAQRVKVCLQSGERRPFQLKLGGEKYDPCSLVKRAKGGTATEPEGVPILDKHSFIVGLVVNGMPQSRMLNRGYVSNFEVVGDCFAEADFQFTATYTEQIGAMAYKKCRARHMFTNGNSPSMHDTIVAHNLAQVDVNHKLWSQPVVLVDQGSSVRAVTRTTTGGNASLFTT